MRASPSVLLCTTAWLMPAPRVRFASMAAKLTPDYSEVIKRRAAEWILQPLQMPKRLSPTAITAFQGCQQQYLFQKMWKVPEPPSPVLYKGILVHEALEKIYDLPPEQRRAQLHDALRDAWRVERKKPSPDASGTASRPLHEALFTSREEERQWGLECLALLDSYAAFEDPAALPYGEPVSREGWLEAQLPTAADLPPLTLLGKFDRLDALPGGAGLVVVDYKTGKAPYGQWSEKDRFQLRCYALMLARGEPPRSLKHLPITDRTPRQLRLLYLKEGAATIEETLPADGEAYEALLDDTQERVLQVWREIAELVENGRPEDFSHCDRSFCLCHEVRPLVFPDFPGR